MKYLKLLIQLIIRILIPANKFTPVSRNYGSERGTPIDRPLIEKFLLYHRAHIKGKCLEITDNYYTKKFGKNITASDILDINPKNKKANIISDLRSLHNINSNTYDCIILTHVLGLIDNLDATVSEIYRILRPNGVVLLTSSCLGTLKEKVYWRLTPFSLKYLFGKKFKKKSLKISTFGNLYLAQNFLAGNSKEDVDDGSFNYNDPQIPCIVTLVGKKSI